MGSATGEAPRFPSLVRNLRLRIPRFTWPGNPFVLCHPRLATMAKHAEPANDPAHRAYEPASTYRRYPLHAERPPSPCVDLAGCRKTRNSLKNRHPGMVVTPEWGIRGDGVAQKGFSPLRSQRKPRRRMGQAKRAHQCTVRDGPASLGPSYRLKSAE